MTKRIAILIFSLALLLAACQSAATPPAGPAASSSTAVEEIQDLAAATATVPAAQATQPDPGTATTVQPSGPAACTATGRQPTPDPTQESLFPPVGDKDWVQGPDSATVTFFEYSDFQ